jgi:hypothetical protein
MRSTGVLVVAALVLAGSLPSLAAAAPAEARPTTLVVCAPGYPGSTGEAAPVMDAFAAALAAAAGEPAGALAVEYHETEEGGVARLARPDAGLLLAPLPFFLAQEDAFHLVARAQAVIEGGQADEEYALVASKGKLGGAAALAGWEIVSTVGYAPRFVRGPVLGGWGVLPATARVTFSGAVLSALRRSASGADVAVLLDRAQTQGLAGLPFGAGLEVVTRSGPLPAFLVASVGSRVSPSRADVITKTLIDLASRPGGATTLASLRLARFVPLDEEKLGQARRAFAAAKP